MHLNGPPRPAARNLSAAALLLLCALALVTFGAPRPASAQDSVTMSVTAAFEGNYAPGRWLPLSIVLRNDGPATRALLAASLPNGNSRSALPIELPGGQETRATLYVAMDSEAREVRVALERDGAALAAQEVEVRPREGERMLAVVSAQPLQLNLPRREDLQALPFLSFSLEPAALPDRLPGLSSLSLLLLNGVPVESLRPEQLDVLRAWVMGGGHLVIGGGPGAGPALGGLPADLLPAAPGQPANLDPAPLAEISADPAPARLEGIALAPRPGAVSFGAPAAPLWSQQRVGLGQVTLLAFDPGLRAISEWPGAPDLWDRLLRPAQIYRSAFSEATTPDLLRELTIAAALGNLPAVNLPRSELLFALLAIYAVLIGPGLALLLRRFDRQDLGWLLLPALAVAVFAVTLGIALASRSDERIVSQISLVEQVSPQTARARTAIGIVTPRAERFNLSLPPAALVRQIQSTTSQFGPVSGATGDLHQESGAVAVDVAAWEVQGVLAEALVPQPALAAEIVLSSETIEAVVRNTSGQELRDVAVAYGSQVVLLGNLAPDEEARATWPPAVAGAADTALSALVLGDELEAGRSAGGQIDRRLLIREALLSATVNRGGVGPEPGPFVLGWMPVSPLSIGHDAAGAARQQISLLVGRPRFSGAGRVAIPAGWMQLEPALGQPTCSGPTGRGLAADGEALTMTLALPADLAALRAEELTFELGSERPWPNAGVRTELYDWQAGQWVAVPFDGPGSLTVREAGPYLGNGRLSIRLGGRIGEAGCVFASARLRGELPEGP